MPSAAPPSASSFCIGLVVAGSATLGACAARYKPPELPPEQLALVTLDERAKVLSVAGLEPPQVDGSDVKEFRLETGCQELVVKYEQTESTLKIDAWSDSLIDIAGKVANSEHRHYQTFQPIHFFVPARAGNTYWVTATFTGDEFLPRIVELDGSGATLQRFEPDVSCGPANWHRIPKATMRSRPNY